MAISAKEVMRLRQRTSVGMMQCKEALVQTDGDFEAAIEVLRKKLKGKMDDRTDRQAPEGVVAVARSNGAIAMVQLACETDFVARNETFAQAAGQIAQLVLDGADGPVTSSGPIDRIVDNLRITIQENIVFKEGVKLTGDTLGSYVHHNHKIGVVVAAEGDLPDDLLKGICQHIAAAVPVPLTVDEASLPADLKHQQELAAVEEAKATGKPQQISEKIAVGKLRKWVDEHTLMGQIYLRELDAKKPVRDFLPKGASIRKFVRYQLGS